MQSLRRLFLPVLIVLMTATTPLAAGSFGYITPAELKTRLEGNTPLHLVDIQLPEGYAEHHLPGTIATSAYPVKTAEERARLDAVLGVLKTDEAPVVIVCPRGGGGAERAYDHLASQGIARDRLLILEKGQEGWPYPQMVEKTR